MIPLTRIGGKGGDASLGARLREIGFQINEFKLPILSKKQKDVQLDFNCENFF